MIEYIIPLIATFAAPPHYTEIEINDLHVSSINTLNGKSTLNARRIDINQDGLSDLVFPDRVLLQENGTFNEENAISLPQTDLGPAIDFFNHTLYLRFSDSLKTYTFTDQAWAIGLDIEMTWPHEATADPADETQPLRTSLFEQYLHDIDGDSVPELLFPLQDGLHIYRLDGNRYHATPTLDVFPESKLMPLDSALSVAGITRQVAFPDQHVSFQCAIEHQTLSILTRINDSPETIRYQTKHYSLSYSDTAYHAALVTPVLTSPPLAPFMQPIRLSPDSELAYAGGRLDYASTLAILNPQYITTLQLPDKPQTRYRTKSFAPHTLFTDMNHDGKSDLVLETTHITDGSLRRTLTRFTTQKKFTHTINIHLNDDSGTFDSEPDYSKTITIKLDQTPIRLSTMFERYQAGKLINCTGDFNRDGKNDLMVQTRVDTLSLYLSTADGFERHPALTIPINEFETFHVIDINGDSISDLLFEGIPIDAIQTRPPTRALLFHVGTHQ